MKPYWNCFCIVFHTSGLCFLCCSVNTILHNCHTVTFCKLDSHGTETVYEWTKQYIFFKLFLLWLSFSFNILTIASDFWVAQRLKSNSFYVTRCLGCDFDYHFNRNHTTKYVRKYTQRNLDVFCMVLHAMVDSIFIKFYVAIVHSSMQKKISSESCCVHNCFCSTIQFD